jgi:hypothetical protein
LQNVPFCPISASALNLNKIEHFSKVSFGYVKNDDLVKSYEFNYRWLRKEVDPDDVLRWKKVRVPKKNDLAMVRFQCFNFNTYMFWPAKPDRLGLITAALLETFESLN